LAGTRQLESETMNQSPIQAPQATRILLSERASQALADSGGIELEERLLADPIRDHLPASAPQRKVRGVLALLDEIAREQSNREACR
jgi:hypothetical protein